MNSALKFIFTHSYKPWLTKYLSKPRWYRYQDVRLKIAPEVFHPGFFFSTKILLQYLGQFDLSGKKILELGCGSGLISIVAAKKNALVTATDINPVAVKFLEENSRKNNVALEIIESDLFANISSRQFDIIAINPPYYKNKPVAIQDYAWFCGEWGEYFEALFHGLAAYMHETTEVIMILSDGCDQEMINKFAGRNGFVLRCKQTQRNILERNFIFKIEKE